MLNKQFVLQSYWQWLCFSEGFYIVFSITPHSPILLTEDGITPSVQQAVGSSVSAIILYKAPLGVPRWSFTWVLDDGLKNTTVATAAIQQNNLTLQFQTANSSFSSILTFSNTPTQLTTSSDTITASLTINNLLTLHSGFKIWFFSSAVPPRQSYPNLQVRYCPKGLGTRAKLTTSTVPCGYQCNGTFTCPPGFMPVNTSNVMCLANATWDASDFDCILGNSSFFVTASTTSIERRSNVYAVGSFDVVVPFTTSNISQSCSWNYTYIGSYNNYSNSFLVISASSCISPSAVNNTNVTISCAVAGTNVSSNLTFTQRLEFGRIDAMFYCGSRILFTAILNIVYCQDFEDGIFIDRTSRFCGFGCIGAYTCSPGYLTKDNPPLITCNKYASWDITRDFCILDRLRTWRLTPENGSALAVGYPALSIEAEVFRSESISCSWHYQGELNEVEFLTRGICVPVLRRQRDTVFCHEANASIIGELRIDGPLQPGSIDIRLECNNFLFLSTSISIEYCTKVQDGALIVANQFDCGYSCLGSAICLSSIASDFFPVQCTAVARWNISRNCTNGDLRLRGILIHSYTMKIYFTVTCIILSVFSK